MKKPFFKRLCRVIRPGGQEGMALVIALMLLAVLGLLGSAALLTTT
jgi:Tfp pilus assembly protein PilX